MNKMTKEDDKHTVEEYEECVGEASTDGENDNASLESSKKDEAPLRLR